MLRESMERYTAKIHFDRFATLSSDFKAKTMDIELWIAWPTV
jgi:hypothetical protein